MNYENEIKLIYEKYGSKHFSKQIKKNKELFQFVLDHTTQYQNLTISQRCFIVLNRISPICEISNKKKRWINFDKGFGFCGIASFCQCSNESVSNNVKKTKAQYSKEYSNSINNKRTETNLKKYGVENTGQLDYSKQRHKDFYSNTELVLNQLKKDGP